MAAESNSATRIPIGEPAALPSLRLPSQCTTVHCQDGVIRVQKDIALYELGARNVVQRIKAHVADVPSFFAAFASSFRCKFE